MRKLWGFIFLLFIFVAFTGLNATETAVPDKGFGVIKKDLSIKDKPVYVEDEIIVTFKKGYRKELEKVLIDKFGLIKKEQKLYPDLFTVFKMGKADDDVKKIMEAVKSVDGIVAVEQNAWAYAFAPPNDPYYPYQWHMNKIGMEEAWEIGAGNGPVVAVIDTGIKRSLEDLARTNFVGGWDFINDDNDPTDDNGHGSHVAGTIAQSTNNRIGVAGVAYEATLMPVKVLNANGSGPYSTIAFGIMWAVDNGADVINLSLGGSVNSPTLEYVINYAWNNGVVVVCAAGNNNVSTPFYPAAYANSISVVATDYADARAPYSNYGSTVDIAAPGGNLNVDLNGDGYGDGVLQQTCINGSDGYYFMQGTSMASPHVAGVAAMMKSVNSSLTNAQIKSQLYSTATDIGAPGFDNQFGHGLLNAFEAAKSVNYCYIRRIEHTLNALGSRWLIGVCITVLNVRNQPVPNADLTCEGQSSSSRFRFRIRTDSEGKAYYSRIERNGVSGSLLLRLEVRSVSPPRHVYRPELNRINSIVIRNP
jgi:serine protease